MASCLINHPCPCSGTSVKLKWTTTADTKKFSSPSIKWTVINSSKFMSRNYMNCKLSVSGSFTAEAGEDYVRKRYTRYSSWIRSLRQYVLLICCFRVEQSTLKFSSLTNNKHWLSLIISIGQGFDNDLGGSFWHEIADQVVGWTYHCLKIWPGPEGPPGKLAPAIGQDLGSSPHGPFHRTVFVPSWHSGVAGQTSLYPQGSSGWSNTQINMRKISKRK